MPWQNLTIYKFYLKQEDYFTCHQCHGQPSSNFHFNWHEPPICHNPARRTMTNGGGRTIVVKNNSVLFTNKWNNVSNYSLRCVSQLSVVYAVYGCVRSMVWGVVRCTNNKSRESNKGCCLHEGERETGCHPAFYRSCRENWPGAPNAPNWAWWHLWVL